MIQPNENGQRNIFDQFLRDRVRWFLWSPALIGFGIALYYSLPVEPGLVWLAVATLLALFTYFVRSRSDMRIIVIAWVLLLVSAGFSSALIRTQIVDAPILQKKEVSEIRGTVLEKSTGYKSARFLLGDLSFIGKNKIPSLVHVRISSRSKFDAVMPGQIIRVKAVLLPPPEPAYPGGYDFQRHSYYQSIGAVGYSISPFKIIGESKGLFRRLQVLSAEVRGRIANFVLSHVSSKNAGFIIAIMTGDKAAIPEDQLDNMRDSGLAHLLAISGLHMGMIGGLIFFAMRFLLVLSPYIALYYPVKKIAAVTALIGLSGYLFVSGMSISAIRAFIMIAAVFAAICFDRTAVSLRMVALAAVIILILFPESLLSASFQMSFAAVFALISLYERLGPNLGKFARSGGVFRRGVAYFIGIALTSLIAGLATAPFALYHFGQVAAYSLIANLIAVPIMGLWVMPGVILSFIGYAFGLSFPLVIVGSGIDVILWAARVTVSWPNAVQYLGSFSVLQLLAITLIGLWCIIWRQSIRWLALPMLVILMVSFFFNRSPDILISDSGNLYALRTEEGAMYLSSRRADKFEAERWRLVMGKELAMERPNTLTCDPYGCIYQKGTELIAFPETIQAIEIDCKRADIIISGVPAPKACQNARLVIDKFDLWRKGAHSLYFEDSGEILVESANGLRGDRPWIPQRYRESLSKLRK